MVQQQTILGFFEDAAEARQAVQLLLAQGFTRDNVNLSTLTDLNSATPDGITPLTEVDSGSGRFLSSLFGSSEEAQDWRGTAGVARTEAEIAYRSGTLITIQTQSIDEAKQVAGLLDAAGAGDVVVDKRPDPNQGEAIAKTNPE